MITSAVLQIVGHPLERYAGTPLELPAPARPARSNVRDWPRRCSRSPAKRRCRATNSLIFPAPISIAVLSSRVSKMVRVRSDGHRGHRNRLLGHTGLGAHPLGNREGTMERFMEDASPTYRPRAACPRSARKLHSCPRICGSPTTIEIQARTPTRRQVVAQADGSRVRPDVDSMRFKLGPEPCRARRRGNRRPDLIASQSGSVVRTTSTRLQVDTMAPSRTPANLRPIAQGWRGNSAGP